MFKMNVKHGADYVERKLICNSIMDSCVRS